MSCPNRRKEETTDVGEFLGTSPPVQRCPSAASAVARDTAPGLDAMEAPLQICEAIRRVSGTDPVVGVEWGVGGVDQLGEAKVSSRSRNSSSSSTSSSSSSSRRSSRRRSRRSSSSCGGGGSSSSSCCGSSRPRWKSKPQVTQA